MGSPGAGKTTTARPIAAAMGRPFLETDDIHWSLPQPMYQP
jgi:adenylate kinase family enzyme